MPSGEKITLTYAVLYSPPLTLVRLQSVNSSSGYQLKFEYDPTIWYTLKKVTGINNGIDYCDPAANSCAGMTQTWPAVTYATATVGSNKQESVTDPLNRVTRYTTDSSGRMIGIKRPSSTTDTTTITYDANGRIQTVANPIATWTYGWSVVGTTLTGTVTDPLSHQRVTTADTGKLVVLTDTDALNRTTNFQYDTEGRLTYIVPPEGTITAGAPAAGYVKLDYDARGNVTTTTQVSKTPGMPPNIVTSAAYPPTCASQLTCNKPTATTDERGNVTDYEYDLATGFVRSIKSPLVNGVRPETRFVYSPLYAYYKQTSGGSPVAGTPMNKLTTVSTCATLSSCAGQPDEIRTTISYGPQTAGAANNLLPASVTSGAASGSPTATTAYVYDMVGNPFTADGPLAGTGDTTRYRFDAARQLTGVVSPDPDGPSSLKNRALRYAYNLDGQSTLIEQGTVNSQSDTDWANFVTLRRSLAAYDALARKVTDAVGDPSSYLSLSQYSYDAANRLDCTAARMNGSDYGSLPASACTATTTGSFGPDRIAKNGSDRVRGWAEPLCICWQRSGKSRRFYRLVTRSSVRDQSVSLSSAGTRRQHRCHRTLQPGSDRTSRRNPSVRRSIRRG